MGVYFLDASAIIKRYILERGQAWIIALCNPANNNDLFISQATHIEVVATLCRRAREQSIVLTERDRLIAMFRRDCRASYNTWPVTDDIYAEAGDICRRHPLRSSMLSN